MESIIQKDKTKCFLCKQNACGDYLARHHIFGASARSASEEYGLVVYLHNNRCHIYGENAVHRNKDIRRRLQAYAQRKAMENYGWTIDDFRLIFHRNYL